MERLIFAFIIVIYSSIIHAELTMQIEATKIQKGETFRLIITNDKMPTGVPDLTPLQADFTIVGTERSTNYSIINGTTTSSNQWTVLLLPKKTGILSIPAIRVGQEYTPAKTIEVTNIQNSTKSTTVNKQQDVILTAELSNEHPYINEQIIYTVKLYNSRRLLDVNYQGPQIDDALLIPLGDGRRYQVAENGRLYSVEEQQYAIFPQKSGELNITPPSFNALIYDAIPEPVHVQASASKLQVKSIPASFKGKNWLPAKQINLTEQYDQTTNTIQQGNTLRRTITLQAIGTPAQLLPNLTFDNTDQFSVYPEKPIEKNRFRQFDLIGTATINITYLLNKSGQVTIPAIQLPWFNIITNKTEMATLPALTLNVVANPVNINQTNSNATTSAVTTQQSQPTPSNIKHGTNLTNTQPINTFNLNDKNNGNLPWWLAGGFALAWVLTLFLWWWARKRPNSGHISKRKVFAQLKQACLTNQPEQARIALLNWARWQWPGLEFLNLDDINKVVSDIAFKREINELSKAIYHPHQSNWSGEKLWQLVTNYKLNSASRANRDRPLKPLNPL
ncbi:KQDN repeat-containing protein [Legionella busanensis]|uniref:KQDN repeat-containing protein n=1 Tax=Legionella busanensis TaxID=190655 RepID=A0A378JP26_9GAMM|nr:protein BatD [Legionella busanensis]STX52837.1 KQDN repeat-containing protein [Legionella busanensis]